MAKSNSFGVVWPLEQHTRAKHDILRRYLAAWFPIMDRWNERIVYIDGFAGPGEYAGGEAGSPVIALRTALEHRQSIRHELVCLFIERDRERYEHLQQLVAREFQLPQNIKVDSECGRFDEHMTRVLDYLDEQHRRLAPTFAFIDPFGYSDTPFSVVQRIMLHDKCEVLITFMYDHINRFLSHPEPALQQHYDGLFGTPDWRQGCTMTVPEDRRQFIHDLYVRQLRDVAGVRYVRSFVMLDRGNRTDYFLFFGTKNLLGLKKMKEAMWKADPTSGTQFSDATDPNQSVLFEPEPSYGLLRRLLVDRFSGRDARLEDIERFVVENTPFRETHFKRQILKPLEEAAELRVVKAPATRKQGQFPVGTVVRIQASSGPSGTQVVRRPRRIFSCQ